ncbi:PREDICTED: uncharacterized protein LOC101365635 [Odobenus rosmarus divergens]|uniref:Uncharacterized protein LOC101365635 n=1 Tax=Odobenus rosmarus divergens TaxID=9708 RepID=A0A9B0H203_ODORO
MKTEIGGQDSQKESLFCKWQGALHALFQQNPYPGIATRERLARELEVPESRIHVWFQNWRTRPLRQSRLRSAKSERGRATTWTGTASILDSREATWKDGSLAVVRRLWSDLRVSGRSLEGNGTSAHRTWREEQSCSHIGVQGQPAQRSLKSGLEAGACPVNRWSVPSISVSFQGPGMCATRSDHSGKSPAREGVHVEAGRSKPASRLLLMALEAKAPGALICKDILT